MHFRHTLGWGLVRLMSYFMAYLFFLPTYKNFIAFILLDLFAFLAIQFVVKAGAFKRSTWMKAPNPILLLLLLPGFLYILFFWTYEIFAHKCLKLVLFYTLLYVIFEFLLITRKKWLDFRYGKKLNYLMILQFLFGFELFVHALLYTSSPLGFKYEIMALAIIYSIIFFLIVRYLKSRNEEEFGEILSQIRYYPDKTTHLAKCDSQQKLEQELVHLLSRYNKDDLLESRSMLIQLNREREDEVRDVTSLIHHDLSGQMHVLQFCVDELGPHLSSPDTLKYYQKLNSVIQRMSLFLNKLRNFDSMGDYDNAPMEIATFVELVNFKLYMRFKKTTYQVHFALDSNSSTLPLPIHKIRPLHNSLYFLLSYLVFTKAGEWNTHYTVEKGKTIFEVQLSHTQGRLFTQQIDSEFGFLLKIVEISLDKIGGELNITVGNDRTHVYYRIIV